MVESEVCREEENWDIDKRVVDAIDYRLLGNKEWMLVEEKVEELRDYKRF